MSDDLSAGGRPGLLETQRINQQAKDAARWRKWLLPRIIELHGEEGEGSLYELKINLLFDTKAEFELYVDTAMKNEVK